MVTDQQLEDILVRARAAIPGPYNGASEGFVFSESTEGTHPEEKKGGAYGGKVIGESIDRRQRAFITAIPPEVVIAALSELLERRNPAGLKEKLLARVGAWFDAAAIRIRDDHFADAGQLTLTLSQPGGDDDGTLCLEARITEKAHIGVEGRVEGVKYGEVY